MTKEPVSFLIVGQDSPKFNNVKIHSIFFIGRYVCTGIITQGRLGISRVRMNHWIGHCNSISSFVNCSEFDFNYYSCRKDHTK